MTQIIGVLVVVCFFAWLGGVMFKSERLYQLSGLAFLAAAATVLHQMGAF